MIERMSELDSISIRLARQDDAAWGGPRRPGLRRAPAHGLGGPPRRGACGRPLGFTGGHYKARKGVGEAAAVCVAPPVSNPLDVVAEFAPPQGRPRSAPRLSGS